MSTTTIYECDEPLFLDEDIELDVTQESDVSKYIFTNSDINKIKNIIRNFKNTNKEAFIRMIKVKEFNNLVVNMINPSNNNELPEGRCCIWLMDRKNRLHSKDIFITREEIENL